MQTKVARYTILEVSGHLELAIRVNELIAAGWQPWGSSYVAPFHDDLFYCQPMVKYETEEDKEARNAN